jgi:dTDP-4-amino-4,6-dideoxygalactose transaminase
VIVPFAKRGDVSESLHLGIQPDVTLTRELQRVLSSQVFLTPSGTASLELAMLSSRLAFQSEVILPSYTFSTSASSIVLAGGVPVFIDISPETTNIDPDLIEAAVTDKTVGIVPVHYAGVTCDMAKIVEIARRYDLWIVEDAAQGIGAYHNDSPLGTLGDMGAISFHYTKNLSAGEGGALVVNNPELVDMVEMVRDKGTNRSRFLRGEVDKYTWEVLGSSYLMSEPSAAYLLPQLLRLEQITAIRLEIWNRYFEGLATLQEQGLVSLPYVPDYAKHNGHIFYLILNSLEERLGLTKHLLGLGIQAVSHYVPLHSSPAGRKYGRVASEMTNTDRAGDCLLRLPIYPEMQDQVDFVIESVLSFFRH